MSNADQSDWLEGDKATLPFCSHSAEEYPFGRKLARKKENSVRICERLHEMEGMRIRAKKKKNLRKGIDDGDPLTPRKGIRESKL